ncbi:serine hydroxymethyltransferase [Actinophytocola xinjiangensis]|uniref:Serine hydroxymethyltransferase n=1 Tax=Actinophytocola xinjiangensis TaxID=485602 RepID=A0A7Z0WNP9_9PSEU|nr:serine hydroxymethyltransferase [Actinophytocola xinjiangensis]OLF10544.1 serine hydroxymethyltransferase [Actinophytocola xinjiangensis]
MNGDDTSLGSSALLGVDLLAGEDPELHDALHAEHRRQETGLMLVASSSITDPSVLACLASSAMNVTAEGYPGARYHAGCEQIDVIERLAVDRARKAFGARYVNVQPHSATTANYAVLSSLLRPGDVIMGMRLDQGGHLTHGFSAAYSGSYFTAVGYGLDQTGRIDYAEAAALARLHLPKLIICGATSYPRQVDWRRFREIADEVGALLMADISHIAGLVAAGLHPSPIDHAHVTTTCTHKQLAGPRGGLIMSGRDFELPCLDTGRTIARQLARTVFPYFQGAPIMPVIAAKARALALLGTDRYRAAMRQVVDDAAALAAGLVSLGYEVVSGGTDNHIVLVDLSATGISGLVAEQALERTGIIVNKNRVPGDRRAAATCSGIRIGTNSVAQRGLGAREMRRCAELIHRVLRAVRPVSDREFDLDEFAADAVRTEVRKLAIEFPLPRYTRRVPADTGAPA